MLGLSIVIKYWPELKQCQLTLSSVGYAWYYVQRQYYTQRQQAFFLLEKKCDLNSQLWSSHFLNAVLKMTTEDTRRKQVSCLDGVPKCCDG